MINEFLSNERLLNSIDLDKYCLEEESINQIDTQFFKKEDINNFSNPLKKADFLDSPKNQSLNNNSNFSKEEIWKKYFPLKKKEDMNDDDIRSIRSEYFRFSCDNTSCRTGRSRYDNLAFLLDNKKINNEKGINDFPFLLNNKIRDNMFFKNKLNNNSGLDRNENSHEKDKINIINKNEIQPYPIILKRGPYKKRRAGIEALNFEDKCFPFKTGKGIINITTKYNKDFIEQTKENNNDDQDDKDDNDDDNDNDNKDLYSYELDKDEKGNEEALNLNLNLKDNNNNNNNTPAENDLYLKKFMTKKYYYCESGRRKRIKNKRKDKADIMRKKIKSRFHKALKKIINKNLKNAGSRMEFDCIHQCFIGNTSKILNSKCFELTYKEILLADFGAELTKYRHTTKDNDKHLKNLRVLKYLENNPEISRNSGFDLVKDIKYKDLLNKYFLSLEFEDSLNQLKKENESEEYIQGYICCAKNYINFYNNFHLLDKDKNNNGMEIKEDYNFEDNNFNDSFENDENAYFDE
jgi:hypothetical protein